jgi:hypothetical protein
VTAQTPVHDTPAGLIAAAAGDSWVPPGPAAAGERVRSLEVRWIFPGRLAGAVAGWFGRFPARTESREDAYLLDPQRPGVSVKVRGGGPVEVKVYRGSPGILEVAGHARGRLEAWQKWSLALRPPGPGSGPAAGWRLVRKRRRISRFSLADGQIAARTQQRGREPACEVELTEIRTSGQDWWTLGFEATGPVGLLRGQLQATAAHVFAQALPGSVDPSPDHSSSYPQWLGLARRPGTSSDASPACARPGPPEARGRALTPGQRRSGAEPSSSDTA